MQVVYLFCSNIVKQSSNMCIVSLALVNGRLVLLHALILIGSKIIQNSHPSKHQHCVLSYVISVFLYILIIQRVIYIVQHKALNSQCSSWPLKALLCSQTVKQELVVEYVMFLCVFVCFCFVVVVKGCVWLYVYVNLFAVTPLYSEILSLWQFHSESY